MAQIMKKLGVGNRKKRKDREDITKIQIIINYKKLSVEK